MDEVLQEFFRWFALDFIDEILVYSWSRAEYNQHFVEVLKCLIEFHLFLKTEKCFFHLSSVQFLAYNIRKHGIQMKEG